VGYVYIGSFQTEPGDGNLDEVLINLAPCRALIVDVRNNGGGQITAAEKCAARFTNEEILVGYMRHKTGTGHNDFSDMEEQRLKPSSGVRWQKKVFVLTNRSVYSAANAFAVMMHALPNVTLVGDHTGGGGGMPLNSSLPNGWNVRFSACPLYDKDARHTEFGIAPDVAVNLTAASIAQDKDDIIEKARELLLK
jgi:C-terminal processing protease CtpA/Prc